MIHMNFKRTIFLIILVIEIGIDNKDNVVLHIVNDLIGGDERKREYRNRLVQCFI
jgi:hypothetical protein